MPTEKQIRNQISKLKKDLKKVKSNKTWVCFHCGKGSKISSLEVYEPKYWNNDPYALGCYTERYGDFYIPCPKCKKVNRLMCYTDYNYKNSGEPIIREEDSKDWILINNNIDCVKKHEEEEYEALMKRLKI